MLLLSDECVPQSVPNVFADRGHTVRYVAKELGPRTPDPLVAAFANKIGAIVITWNYRHFRRLIYRRTAAGDLAFPNMGLLAFRCPEVDGARRLRSLMETIEFEYEHVQQLADKRLLVLVDFDHLRIFR